jgi:hypothetical protein
VYLKTSPPATKYNQSSDGTPPSNTGYDSQPPFQVALDWLDITYRKIIDTTELYAIIAELEALTRSAIDFSPTKPVFNGRMWDGSGRGTNGVLLWYDSGDVLNESDSKSPQLKIAMSGRVMAEVDQGAIAAWLIKRAASNDLDCSRMDICLDDRDKFVSLDSVLSASQSRNFFNAKYRAYQESDSGGDDIGRTIYFGHPSSSRRLRIYDKTVESGGRVLGNRWEVEFRKLLARECLYEWLEATDTSAETVARWCKNVILGAVDFRDRSGLDPNRNRCKLLPWFSSFIRKLQGTAIVIRAAIVKPTMQRSIDWVQKSVAPTMASLRTVLDSDFPKFLEQLLQSGTYRLSNIRRKIIAQSDKEQLYY